MKLLAELSSQSEISHKIILQPHALIFAFGNIGNCKHTIIDKVREKESLADQARCDEKKSVLSRDLLLTQQINRDHIPKKRPGERRIFVLSSIKSLRDNYIYLVKEFCRRCSECYKKAKLGIASVGWPNDAFRPFLPPLAATTI